MNNMEKNFFLLLLLFCNIMWLYAQNDKIAQMETSLEKIRKDLQQKKLEYIQLDTNERISGLLRHYHKAAIP